VKALEEVGIANPGYGLAVFLTILFVGTALLVDGMKTRVQ
jgi:hypothetical protein